jgi:hypothetical protein
VPHFSVKLSVSTNNVCFARVATLNFNGKAN